jgi:hypothetical protein
MSRPRKKNTFDFKSDPSALSRTAQARSTWSSTILGSGRLIAAERTRPACDGIELAPHCCEVVLARWEAFSGETAQLNERRPAASIPAAA